MVVGKVRIKFLNQKPLKIRSNEGIFLFLSQSLNKLSHCHWRFLMILPYCPLGGVENPSADNGYLLATVRFNRRGTAVTSGSFLLGTTSLPSHILDGLAPLLLATKYAQQVGSDPWEFAVEIDQLVALGLTPNDFRLLVRAGVVTHQREVTLEGENGRQFQTAGDLTYCERSCFLLTESGVELAQQLHQANPALVSIVSKASTEGVSKNGSGKTNGTGKSAETAQATVPIWDSERRELRFDDAVVKHYKWVAVNQQAVLCAFEEEGWPPRIDDPLPPHEEQDSKRRLADTIKCLNRKQCHAVIHFRGDGTGEGIIWEIAEIPE